MRVIAGEAKGRALVAPRGLAIRPTTDRVKEAIFSMLGAVAMRRSPESLDSAAWPFRVVLDLYAGTGALGIEALSRGAAHVDFVEPAARARAALLENLRRTGFGARASVHALRARTALSTLPGPYDLILLDPPYDDPGLDETLDVLGASALLATQVMVVIEHAKSHDLPAQARALALARRRYHGATAISLYTTGGRGTIEDPSHGIVD